MNTATLIKFAASSLAVATIISGCAQGHMPIASASQPASFVKAADKFAAKATKAMSKGKYSQAVDLAERAVAGAPDNASYRATLGQAYLNVGRFTSAEDALSDALSLDQGNGRIALNLALAQIANGKNDTAMRTLDDHRTVLSAADYGLAVALAGDPAGAVTVLETAARDGRADTKLRQNLALAYALAGKWANARVMAAQDLSPELVDTRMTEWAHFVRPSGASQQVASLLGVTPVSDAGMPTQLALQPKSDQMAAVNAPEAEPVDVAAVSPVQPVDVAAATPAPAFEMEANAENTEAPLITSPTMPAKVRQVVMPAKRAEKLSVRTVAVAVAAKPAVRTVSMAAKPAARPVVAAAKPTMRTAAVAAKPAVAIPVAAKSKGIESGTFVVQLGAFATSARAQAAWNGAIAKTKELSKFTPTTARMKADSSSLFRMSVSGFATRDAATQVCARVKAAGGSCFVRSVAGDAPTQWVQRGGARVAVR